MLPNTILFLPTHDLLYHIQYIIAADTNQKNYTNSFQFNFEEKCYVIVKCTK